MPSETGIYHSDTKPRHACICRGKVAGWRRELLSYLGDIVPVKSLGPTPLKFDPFSPGSKAGQEAFGPSSGYRKWNQLFLLLILWQALNPCAFKHKILCNCRSWQTCVNFLPQFSSCCLIWRKLLCSSELLFSSSENRGNNQYL